MYIYDFYCYNVGRKKNEQENKLSNDLYDNDCQRNDDNYYYYARKGK